MAAYPTDNVTATLTSQEQRSDASIEIISQKDAVMRDQNNEKLPPKRYVKDSSNPKRCLQLFFPANASKESLECEIKLIVAKSSEIRVVNENNIVTVEYEHESEAKAYAEQLRRRTIPLKCELMSLRDDSMFLKETANRCVTRFSKIET